MWQEKAKKEKEAAKKEKVRRKQQGICDSKQRRFCNGFVHSVPHAGAVLHRRAWLANHCNCSRASAHNPGLQVQEKAKKEAAKRKAASAEKKRPAKVRWRGQGCPGTLGRSTGSAVPIAIAVGSTGLVSGLARMCVLSGSCGGPWVPRRAAVQPRASTGASC